MILERAILSPAIQLSSNSSMGGKPSTPNQPSALARPDVQVLRVGKFNHPKYGEFEITQAILSEMKANFERHVRGVDIAFDYFHKSDEDASGWPTELYLKEDGDELWAKVDWTSEAQRKLHEREIRYFSPDFAFAWKDPETGVAYKNVLFGGGLTNRPFVKDMAAIVAAEQKEEEMKLEEMEVALKKLSEKIDGRDSELEKMRVELEEAKKKLAEYGEKPAVAVAPAAAPVEPDEDDIPALKAKLAESEKKCADMADEMKKAKEAKQMAEKETTFNVMLSEGKACVAQKDAFMKGDLISFAKLSQPINLAERGSNAGAGASNTGGGADREDRAMKLAEEKIKADPKLSMGDAISLALKEIQ